MKDKLIFADKNGATSLRDVFKQMNSSSDLVVNKKHGKTQAISFRIYSDQDVEKFTKVNNLTFDNSTVIRWGTRVQVPERNCIVYNSTKGLGLSSNKYTARKLFLDNNIPIPKLVTPDNFELDDLPIIARPFQHKQGKDFVVIKDYGSFLEFYKKNCQGWYFSSFIDKDSEYRVHVAHGRIFSIMKKPRPDDPNIMAWNHAINEEAFEALPWSTWNINMCKIVLRACKALTLDFAAFDIITLGEQVYVLEANTCPSLTTSPYNTEKYAKYFNWLLNKTERREHWEFEDKKKAASLAWKDWMFEDREPRDKEK